MPDEQTMTMPPTSTLDDLDSLGDSSDAQQKVYIGHNLGNRTLTFKVPMYEFHRMSQVANEQGANGEPVAQRKLDPKHSEKLAAYMLRGLVSAAIQLREDTGKPVSSAFRLIQERIGKQPYIALQPIVANLRSVTRNGKNLRGEPMKIDQEVVGFRCWFSQRDVMWVVDGQHRRKAMDLVFQFLEDLRSMRYSKKSLYLSEYLDVPPDEYEVWMEAYNEARGRCTVQVELHLGLGIEEERQLFHDLNNLAKKVERSLALEFDSANPVNAFIKEHLIETNLVQVVSTDQKDWNLDEGALSRKEIVAVNAHLFLNKSNINGAVPSVVTAHIPVGKRFWESVVAISGFGEDKAKSKTVSAQAVVLKAIAKLTYDFAWGRNKDEANLNTLLDNLTDVDLSHANPMWRWYEMTAEERSQQMLSGLGQYLPSESDGNRDIGRFQHTPNGNVMRFGAKHNDIFPIIGDMIRWRLNLPSRRLSAGDIPPVR